MPQPSVQRRLTQTYANIGLETAVSGARPEQIITLLLDGALAAMTKASLYMQAGNIPERCAAISKAIEIVEAGLKASVNRASGGTLASHLITTYDAVLHHLLQANLHASPDSLALARLVLLPVAQAWKEATHTCGN